MADDQSKVRVCIRSRPLSAKEYRTRRCLSISTDKNQISIGDKSYAFDNVFSESSTQRDIYDNCVKSLVDGCFHGFNATIFAYGQTGSGKTFSVVGSPLSEDEEDDDEGIIPRALRQIFSKVSRYETEGKIVNIHISFIEIYNEDFKDLLHPEIQSKDIVIREDREGRIFFTGAREEAIASNKIKDAFRFLEKGLLARTTAETMMNAASSRSHAIFTISIEIFIPDDVQHDDNYSGGNNGGGDSGGGSYMQSKLHIVDLAGSERAKKTGAGGLRLKESVGINQGLLALGKVIRALTTNNLPSQKTATSIHNHGHNHVPYRESKLTRFLQDALGGNSRTVMLACVSPSEYNMQESINTLQYAARARAVQNKVTANILIAKHNNRDNESEHETNVLEESIVGNLKSQITKMKAEILTYKSGSRPEDWNASVYKSSEFREQELGIISNDSVLQDMLNFMKRLQHQFKTCFQALHAPPQPESCGDAWGIVCTSRDIAILLDRFLKRYSSVHETQQNHANNSFEGERGGEYLHFSQFSNSALEYSPSEFEVLRQELLDCREDLKRDEEIFAEKVRELKKTRKQVRQLQQENGELLSDLHELRLKIESYQFQLSHVNKEQNTNGKNEALEDDLEMSIAVAAMEPDISQLMEDLENVSKEKEKLVAYKLKAETFCKEAIEKVERQKIEFEGHERDLSHKLRDLEWTIKSKEEKIYELTESEQKAVDLLDAQQQQMEALEKECDALRQRLVVVHSSHENRSHQSIRTEVEEEERKLRLEFEEKLSIAQRELSHLRDSNKILSRQSKDTAPGSGLGPGLGPGPGHESDSKESLKVQQEREKLVQSFRDEKVRYEESLSGLHDVIDRYKSQSMESERRMVALEEKNQKLQCKIEGWARLRGVPLNQSLTMSISMSMSAAGGKKDFSREDTFVRTVLDKMQEIMSLKETYHAMSALVRVIQEKTIEKNELVKDLEPLLKAVKDKESKLVKQRKEIKAKIKSLSQRIQVAKEESKAMAGAGAGAAGVNVGVDESTLSKLIKECYSYHGHFEELQTRIQNRNFSPETQSQIQILQEDVDAIESELKLKMNQYEELRQQAEKKSNRLELFLPLFAAADSNNNNNINSNPNPNSTEEMKTDIPVSVSPPVVLRLPSSEAFDATISEMLQEDIIKHMNTSRWFRHSHNHNHVESKEENNNKNNNSDADSFAHIIKNILMYKFDSQSRSLGEEMSSRKLQDMLDGKQQECEDVIATLQRTKLELNRQQSEYEDKIQFLVQQLRQAENRPPSQQHKLNRSNSGNNTSNDDGINKSNNNFNNNNNIALMMRPGSARFLPPPNIHMKSLTDNVRDYINTSNSNSNSTNGRGINTSASSSQYLLRASVGKSFERRLTDRELVEIQLQSLNDGKTNSINCNSNIIMGDNNATNYYSKPEEEDVLVNSETISISHGMYVNNINAGTGSGTPSSTHRNAAREHSDKVSDESQGQLQQEVIRRWQSEKERREVLEERNMEMAKQLRNIKKK